jgi:hypothetical protein
MCVICKAHEFDKMTNIEALNNALEMFSVDKNNEHLQELIKVLIELIKKED